MPTNPFDPFAPRPRPPVAPVPSPAPAGPSRWTTFLPWAVAAGLAAGLAWDRFAPARPVGPSGVAAGRAYGVALSRTYADGLDAYLTALAAGTPEPDAQAALQSRWSAARQAAFAATVVPVLAAVRPEGTEWVDEGQKERFRATVRSVQVGLRSVK